MLEPFQKVWYDTDMVDAMTELMLIVLMGLFILWGVQIYRKRPEWFQAKALDKAMGTMGFLALGLIGIVCLGVLLLRML